jgi:hypothetical protein
VSLIHTGDVMDPQFGERTFRTVSSKDLPGLAQVFAWAKKAGVVRVVRHKVVTTKRGRRLGEDPGAFFDRAVTALLEIGPLASQRDPDGWFAWPEVDALLDRLALPMLGGPYAAQGPFPLDDMVAMATDAVLATFEFRSGSDEDVARRIAADVADMMDSLALAGVLTRSGLEDAEADGAEATAPRPTVPGGGGQQRGAHPGRHRHRGAPAGGSRLRVAGRLADASAVELLEAADGLGFAGLVGEVHAWLARRTAEQAAGEMAGAVHELEDPDLATLALMLLAEIGVEVSAPLVRELAVEPRLRGLATCWLVDHGLEPATALYDPGDVEAFADVLACRLATGGPEAVVDAMALAGSHGRRTALIGRLWRLRSDATLGVLESIGAAHPAKAVAKAARKACFQHRSWAASA